MGINKKAHAMHAPFVCISNRYLTMSIFFCNTFSPISNLRIYSPEGTSILSSVFEPKALAL